MCAQEALICNYCKENLLNLHSDETYNFNYFELFIHQTYIYNILFLFLFVFLIIFPFQICTSDLYETYNTKHTIQNKQRHSDETYNFNYFNYLLFIHQTYIYNILFLFVFFIFFFHFKF